MDLPENPEAIESPATDRDYDLLETLSHLLRRSHFRAEALFAQELAAHDVTSRQLAILVAVSKTPGATQRHIGEIVALDGNTLSELVRRMEKRGMVERLPSETDGRSLSVHLTERGDRILSDVFADNRRYQERLTNSLSRDETETLKRLLRKLLGL